jgi:hypothetical protein
MLMATRKFTATAAEEENVSAKRSTTDGGQSCRDSGWSARWPSGRRFELADKRYSTATGTCCSDQNVYMPEVPPRSRFISVPREQ